MPFPTRVIPNRQDIKEVLSNNQVKNILEKTAVSGMVGLLQQLNILSKHASEVFSELLDDTLQQTQRIQKVKGRIRDINNKIQPIEDLYLSKPPNFFYDNPYTEQQWLRKDRMRGFLFRRNKAPAPVDKRRSVCDIPPDLSALDQFTKDKQPCIKKYSDTGFFMNEWIEEQKIKLEEEKRKRKLRKEQRRKNRKSKRKKTKKIMKVKKKKYNEFGEVVEEKEDEFVETKEYDIDSRDLMEQRLGNSKNNKKSKKSKQMQKQPQRQQQRQPSPQPQKQRQPQQIQQKRQPSPQPQMQQRQPSPQPQKQPISQKQNVPPPNPMSNQPGGPPKPPSNPMQTNKGPNVPPPNPMQGNGGPPPNPMQTTSYVQEGDDDDEGGNVPPPNPMQGGPPPPNPMQNSHQSQPSYMGGPPKFQPSHVPTDTQDIQKLGPMTPQMRIMLSMQKAQEQQEEQDRLRKQKEQEYEKQKQKASMMVGMKSSNLLAGIKSGVKLKKIDPDKIKREKPKDGRSLLMQSLQKGAKLKKVNREEINKNKKKDDEPQEGGIFEILKRRQLIADSSSEDSGSDWGSESE